MSIGFQCCSPHLNLLLYSGEKQVRTYFTDSQEKAAQKFACKLLSVLIDVHSLVPPNPPVAARFEALIG